VKKRKYYVADASIPMEDEVIVGGPGPRTSAAMRAGKLMTAERLQVANEAARRGERPSAIPGSNRQPDRREDSTAERKTPRESEMIERQEVDGRIATVSYLTNEFQPASKDEAELIKVVFDDGELLFGVPVRSEEAGNE